MRNVFCFNSTAVSGRCTGGGSGTHWVVVTLEDDAGGVAACVAAAVSVLVHDADGAVLRRLRAGLDVAQVEALPVDDAAGAQRTHCAEQNQVQLHEPQQEVPYLRYQ